MEFAPIASGDRTAFEQLFRTHYRPLCAFAVQYVKDADRAEDLVQDLFFRLWQDRERTNVTTSVKAYLFASVCNWCLTAVYQYFVRSGSITPVPQLAVLSVLQFTLRF